MPLKVTRNSDIYFPVGEWGRLTGKERSDFIENEESQSGSYWITQKFLNRPRRSPCGSDLINACRGRSSSGTQVIEGLIRSYPSFFNSASGSISRRQTLSYTSLIGIEQILESGIPSSFAPRSAHRTSTSSSSSTPPALPGQRQEIDEILSQARLQALQHMSKAASHSAGNIKIEVDTVLATQFTGYTFEHPRDIIRDYGAALIDQELITPTMLRGIVSKQFQDPIFMGPRIPPEAIIAIYHNEKSIWRRPTEVVQTGPHSAIPDSGTRFDRILNIAVGTDDDVLLAQRYLHRKHPSQTDNYTLRPPEYEGRPANIERTSTPPPTPRLANMVRIHIVGNRSSQATSRTSKTSESSESSGSSRVDETSRSSGAAGTNESEGGAYFGETSYSDLCQILADLVRKRRWEGTIGFESTIFLDFVGCGTLSNRQIKELRTAFRQRNLPFPFIHQHNTVPDGATSSTHREFIISLSVDQPTIRSIQKLQRLYPAAIEYKLRRPGPNVRNPLLYEVSQELAPVPNPPPEHLRINVITHGNGTDNLSGMSFESLAKALTRLVRNGQVSGEFNAEAKVTLNFVGCKIPANRLTILYQAFSEKNIELVRSIHRDTELMIDTAGRKIQLVPNGGWQHSHLKQVYEFNKQGQPMEIPQRQLPTRPDLFSLQHAAGPLLAKSAARHHIAKVTATLDTLKQENQLGDEWQPEFESLTKLSDGNYRFNFRRETDVRSVNTRDSSLEAFDTFTKSVAQFVGTRHQFDGQDFITVNNPPEPTVSNHLLNGFSAANRLLSSFAAIRSLINFDRQMKSPYAKEIQAHTMINVAQSIHTLGNETANLTDTLRTTLRGTTEQLGEIRSYRFIGALNRAVGRGFLATNVGFDINNLIHATTPEEKLRASLSLGLDGAMIGLEVAGAVGLVSSAAPPLGFLLILISLGVELAETVHQQHLMTHNAVEAVGRYFENLRRAYSESSVQYDAHRNLLRFDPAAIITKITLDHTPKAEFASQHIIIGKYVPDCLAGKLAASTAALAGAAAETTPRPCTDEPRRLLNIREKMGWPNNAAIPAHAKSATNILLPATPKVKLDYQYIIDNTTSAHTTGLEILRELSRKTSFQFESCGRKVGTLIPTLEDTEIAVRGLGKQNRNIFVPTVSRQVAQRLKYTLEGNQGNYRLFPIRNAQFVLQESSGSASQWTIDLSQIEDLDDLNYSITQEGVLTFPDATRGPIRIDFAQTQGVIELRSKSRTWRLDRSSQSLRLIQIDLGAGEISGSKGARLQTELNSAILVFKVYQLFQQMGMERNIIPGSFFERVFQNFSIQTDRWVRFERFQSGHTVHFATLDTQNQDVITSGDPQSVHVKLLGQIGSVFYFSAGNQIWKRISGHSTDPVHKQSLLFGKASQETEVTGIWPQNGLIFVSQTVPLNRGTGFLEAIYRLNGSGQPELVKLVLPLEDFRSRLPSKGPISASEAFGVIMQLMGVPNAPSANNSAIHSGSLILVVCRDQERRERNFWLNTRSNEFIALDNSLPQDAVPIATSELQNSTQTIYYYSDATKTLYRKRENGTPFAESPIQSTRLMERLRSIKLVEGRLQVESEDGIVYEMNAEGKKRIVKFTAHWITSRQSTWANDVVQLCRTNSSSDSIEIQGIRLVDGTAIACWYDQTLNHFTIASQTLSGEKLLHLGLATDEAGAWIFQPNAGRLYLLPTFTPEAATMFFDNQNRYLTTLLRLSVAQAVLPNEKMARAIRLGDGRIIAWTQSGLTLLLESKMPHHPFVLAVNQDWLSREANQQSHLAQLVSDENYRFYSKIDLPQMGPQRRSRLRNWYDVAERKIVTIPVGRLPAGGDYVGFAPSSNIAYFGNQSSLIALSETETTQEIPSAPTPTRFSDPNRNTNVLSLRIKSVHDTLATTPPMLAGVDTLALHGDINRLAFNQQFWEHHRLILLAPLPATSNSNSSSLGTLELNFINADNLAVLRNENNLVLEFPNQDSPRLIVNRFFEPNQNQPLTLKLPNGLRRKLTSHPPCLAANQTKLLNTLPTEV